MLWQVGCLKKRCQDCMSDSGPGIMLMDLGWDGHVPTADGMRKQLYTWSSQGSAVSRLPSLFDSVSNNTIRDNHLGDEARSQVRV
jgi:hypothetical protein